MTLPSPLAMDGIDGNCVVYRYASAISPAAIGAGFGTSMGSPTQEQRWRGINRVIQTLRADGLESEALGSPGSNLYAVNHQGLWRYNAGPSAFPSTAASGTWSRDPLDGGFAFTNIPTAPANAWTSGVHPVVVSARPYLCGVRRGALGSGQIQGWAYDLVNGTFVDGAGFTPDTGSAHDLNGAGGGSHAECMFNGIFHYVSATTAGSASHDFRTYDPSTDSHTIPSWPAEAETDRGPTPDLLAFNGRLIAIYSHMQGGSAGVPKIMEYSGGSWSDVLDLQVGTEVASTGSAAESTQFCLFSPNGGTTLYALALVEASSGSGDWGWKCYEVNQAITAVNDVTADVLPTSMRTTADGGAGLSNGYGRFQALHDWDTAVGAIAVYLYYTNENSSGNAWSAYQWVDNSTEIASLGSGGDIQHMLSGRMQQTSGSRIWTPGELDILITGRTGVLGGEKLTFRVGGDAGTADKNVEIRYNKLGDCIVTQAGLTGAVTGGSASRSGNVVQNVDADEVTDYTLIIDAAAVGIAAGDRIQYAPRVYV